MFLFGIFGVDSKTKEIKSFHNTICKRCGRYSSYTLYKKFSFFHFFFIPLFRWGHQYFLVSRCCEAVYSILKEKGKRLENGLDDTIDESDLEYEYSQKSYGEKVCRNCGNQVDGEYSFCPHCGSKL